MCVCHTEKAVLTKQFVSTTCFRGGILCTLSAAPGRRQSRFYITRRWRQETLQGKFPLDVLTLRVRWWETKEDLSTVKIRAEATGEGGGTRTIFDLVEEEEAIESRDKTIEWLEKTTFVVHSRR